jgi:MarR family transcriptional regulator, lower aerobic nicotinate degradation pathway regulator
MGAGGEGGQYQTGMKTKDSYRQPGHLIRRAHQMATAVFMQEAKAFDLTAVQFSALVVIREHPGTDATRVSDLIYFDRSTIGNVLDRLEKKGLIRREAGVEDRRTKRLYLTPQGRVVLRKIAAKLPQISDTILKPLSAADRARLVKLLVALVEPDGGRGGKSSPAKSLKS